MRQMTGTWNTDDACVLEIPRGTVCLGVRCPRPGPVDQQRWAGNTAPQPDLLRLRDIDRGDHPDVVVELPAVGTVFILMAAVDGEVFGLSLRQMWVLLPHSLESRLQAWVAARRAACQLLQVVYPVQHPPGDRNVDPLFEQFRRWAESFDDNQLAHSVREQTGVEQRDLPAQRMRDDGESRELGLANQLDDVVDEVDEIVTTPGRPLRVAVPAQVRCKYSVIAPKILGHPVPTSAVVPPAVDQEQRRRSRVAPSNVMQAQALREIDVCARCF